MPVTRLTLCYDGAGFSGWAVQPSRRTVEGELRGALETLVKEPVRLAVAGRTDAGAHALGQVASFATEREVEHPRLLRALNGMLGGDIAVTACEPAPQGFSARYDARSRTYRYRLFTRAAASPFERGRALWWPHALDRAALSRCADLLTGRHDFRAFTPTQTRYDAFERTVLRAGWSEPAPHRLDFEIEAEAFLRGMVRALVGTMLEVGRGRRSVEELGALLGGAHREQGGETAPAHGLYLMEVRYGEYLGLTGGP